MRDNFKLFVIKVNSEDEKLIWLGKYLEKIPGSGILYTGTRVDTEIYSKWFEFLKIPSVGYNAGLDPDSRIAIENGLMKNQWKCVISTNALGMGIDKPDIIRKLAGQAGMDNLQILYFFIIRKTENSRNRSSKEAVRQSQNMRR